MTQAHRNFREVGRPNYLEKLSRRELPEKMLSQGRISPLLTKRWYKGRIKASVRSGGRSEIFYSIDGFFEVQEW